MRIYRQSPLTKRMNCMELDVTEEQIAELQLRPRRLIQEIFPNLSPSEREFLLTGYTQQDWDEMFPEEDE